MEIKLAQGIEPTGRYTLIEADPSRAPDEYAALVEFLRKHPLEKYSGADELSRTLRRRRYDMLKGAYHRKAKVAEHVFDNLVPLVGRTVISRILAGDFTYTGEINYVALGDSTVAPNDSDTVLGNETFRQILSDANFVNNIAYLSAFIAAGTATGTHAEGGLFIDGTASVDTGQLFSHVLFSPTVVKGALNSLTLDVAITVT